MNQTDDKKDLLLEAKTIASFKNHVSIYIVIIGILWIAWYFSGGMEIHPWPVYPTIAWGLGLFFHYLSAYGIYRRTEKRHEEELK
ncbi:MAG TPA: 2TM domain-containing protein [Chitinophagaceae bacterium]|nr:2TM domain-containing protein [Chitinophagaceae bacterium]